MGLLVPAPGASQSLEVRLLTDFPVLEIGGRVFWLTGVLVNREVVALYPRSRSEASSPNSSQLIQQAFVGFTVLLLSSLRGVHIRIVRRGGTPGFP